MNATVFQQCTNAFTQEVCVLEEDQQSEVKKEGEEDEGLCHPTFLFHLGYRLGNEVVGSGDQCQEPEEETTTFIIEVVRKKGDKEDAKGISLAHEIVDEGKAEKEKEENARGEYHRGLRLINQLLYETRKIYIKHYYPKNLSMICKAVAAWEWSHASCVSDYPRRLCPCMLCKLLLQGVFPASCIPAQDSGCSRHS